MEFGYGACKNTKYLILKFFLPLDLYFLLFLTDILYYLINHLLNLKELTSFYPHIF